MNVVQHKPKNLDALQQIVKGANENQQHVHITGGQSKVSMGRFIEFDPSSVQLNMSNFEGIIEYESEELNITLKSATLLEDVIKATEKHDQHLPFDPPDFSRLLDCKAKATIGGVVATSHHGSRRLSAGAVRDYVLGVRFINGLGENIMTGGQVVKNVTGYDLCKMLTGSWGTLGVMHEITLKTLPKPETAMTWRVQVPSLEEASKMMCRSIQSCYQGSAIAYLPKGLSKDQSGVFICFEGTQKSIEKRFEGFLKTLKDNLDYRLVYDQMDAVSSKKLWQYIRDVHAFEAKHDHRDIWRIHVPFSQTVATVKALREVMIFDYYLDWAGGLIWLAIEPEDNIKKINHMAQTIRNIVNITANGQANLVRGNIKTRQTIEVFQPLESMVMQLHKRIKASFDPNAILNPGRFYSSF
ncbi:MAG: FAD-binding protein [Pseudomonadota bacterium]